MIMVLRVAACYAGLVSERIDRHRCTGRSLPSTFTSYTFRSI